MLVTLDLFSYTAGNNAFKTSGFTFLIIKNCVNFQKFWLFHNDGKTGATLLCWRLYDYIKLVQKKYVAFSPAYIFWKTKANNLECPDYFLMLIILQKQGQLLRNVFDTFGYWNCPGTKKACIQNPNIEKGVMI